MTTSLSPRARSLPSRGLTSSSCESGVMVKATSAATRRVLVVDDDPRVTRAIQLNLCTRFVVVAANCGADAIRQLEDNGPFDIIVTDLRMPNMDGIALLEHVRRSYPDTVRVLLSGTVDVAATVRAVNDGGVQGWLLKPAEDDTLEQGVDW